MRDLRNLFVIDTVLHYNSENIQSFKSNSTIKDKVIHRHAVNRISIGESHDFKQDNLLHNLSPSVLHGEGNMNSTNLYENKTFKRKSAKVFEGIPHNKKA